MRTLPLSNDDKKAYINAVGTSLVQTHGSQATYKPEQVEKASKENRYGIDWACWAMCIFCSADDFEEYHRSIGETCDYTAMKSEMLMTVTDGASADWLDLDISWLEWPDIDLSSIFDIFG